jgi:hypothetical protein
MRNASRPIGEKLREIHERVQQGRQERMAQERPEQRSRASEEPPYIVGHDSGDEDTPQPSPEPGRRR